MLYGAYTQSHDVEMTLSGISLQQIETQFAFGRKPLIGTNVKSPEQDLVKLLGMLGDYEKLLGRAYLCQQNREFNSTSACLEKQLRERYDPPEFTTSKVHVGAGNSCTLGAGSSLATDVMYSAESSPITLHGAPQHQAREYRLVPLLHSHQDHASDDFHNDHRRSSASHYTNASLDERETILGKDDREQSCESRKRKRGAEEIKGHDYGFEKQFSANPIEPGHKTFLTTTLQLADTLPQNSIHESRHVMSIQAETKPGYPSRIWTKELDAQLRNEVRAQKDTGAITLQWTKIARRLGKRSGVQCQARWAEVLDEKIRKGRWDEDEDESLRRAHKRTGGQWSKIAVEMVTRTQRQCRSRWLQLYGAANM